LQLFQSSKARLKRFVSGSSKWLLRPTRPQLLRSTPTARSGPSSMAATTPPASPKAITPLPAWGMERTAAMASSVVRQWINSQLSRKNLCMPTA
jgi:hypothetical protein